MADTWRSDCSPVTDCRPDEELQRSFVERAAKLLADAQAKDTVAIDVREVSGVTDYLLIGTVNSLAHVQGLVDQIRDLTAEYDIEPLSGVKRPTEVGWTLVDYGFVVVHLMTRSVREFYELEKLWFSGTRVYGDYER